MNDKGQVVGGSDITGNAARHAFSWTAKDGMVDLGTLGGGTYSTANGVNEKGQVVGYSTITEDDLPSHAFSWTAKDGMVDLGTLGGTNSNASAVNAKGQVVRNSQITGNAASHAALWQTSGGH